MPLTIESGENVQIKPLTTELQILEHGQRTWIRIEFVMTSLDARLKLDHFSQKQIVCAENVGKTVAFRTVHETLVTFHGKYWQSIVKLGRYPNTAIDMATTTDRLNEWLIFHNRMGMVEFFRLNQICIKQTPLDFQMAIRIPSANYVRVRCNVHFMLKLEQKSGGPNGFVATSHLICTSECGETNIEPEILIFAPKK